MTVLSSNAAPAVPETVKSSETPVERRVSELRVSMEETAARLRESRPSADEWLARVDRI